MGGGASNGTEVVVCCQPSTEGSGETSHLPLVYRFLGLGCTREPPPSTRRNRTCLPRFGERGSL